jgi:tryptophan synthase alpha chain
MSLSDAFKKPGAAFMPYLCCGDPDAEFTLKAARALAASGADALELGIPFSDPIADGKSIQAASVRALRAGMSPDKALGILGRIRREAGIPLIIMTYYNIILANGGGSFLGKARSAGAGAIIVPDVPLEESDALQAQCTGAGLKLVRMVSPSCSDERIARIAEKAEGFVYAVGALGTTSARASLGLEAAGLVRKVKAISNLPVAVGFGVSKPEHAKALAQAGADGIIVGSAIADIYSGYIRKDGRIEEAGALRALGSYAREMKSACVTRV